MLKLVNYKISKHKRKYTYILMPWGFGEKVTLTAKFLERKQVEIEELRREIALLGEKVRIEKEYSILETFKRV